MNTSCRIGAPAALAILGVLTSSTTALAFVKPFGVRSHHNPVAPDVCPAFHLPPHRACQPLMFAKRTSAGGSDEDDWKPNDADLVNEMEELSLGKDADVDIADDEVLVDNEETAGTINKVEDDYDDEDILDEDIDIWEEDDEDGIVEEIDASINAWDGKTKASSYLGNEVEYTDEDWDEDEYVPLQDDPNDPNYMAQKKLVEETVARREKLAREQEFDEFDFVANMSDEQIEIMNNLPSNKELEEKAKEFITITEDDVKGMDLEKELAKTPDLMLDDPYENKGEEDILGTGMSEDDLQQLDQTYKRMHKNLAREPWDKVSVKVETTDFATLDNETVMEMSACLDEIGGSAYNCTRWLLYDLDFNVSNLILAAIKHNRNAPILFQHWYPQLMTYERYQHARDRNFDFNWEDVENADMEELELYYRGFGYDEIPSKAPAETGIISMEELDEEELKMAAFQAWMTEVYNPEWDRKDFDDDTFRDEDNVFSDYFVEPEHPDLPTFEDSQEDLAEWEEEMGDEEEHREYRDFMGKDHRYQYVEDKEFEKEFRGHLVVACTPMDEDLEIAETITARMGEVFGKKIFVETRVMAHAREEDCVFEVWLESYDIELLHSKKRATSNAKGWDGPADCDDAQIEQLVERVRFLISDDSRYSYQFDADMVV